MKKLSISELTRVLGGRNEHECKKVQALANAYIKDGASADAWDKWADDFVKHC